MSIINPTCQLCGAKNKWPETLCDGCKKAMKKGKGKL